MGNIITKYKIINWYNPKTRELLFGIDVQIDNIWHHLTEGRNKKCIYHTLEEAKTNIKSFKSINNGKLDKRK